MPRLRLLLAATILAAVITGVTGCSTVQSISTTGEYFGGSRADLAYFGEPEHFDESIAIFGLIDFPFSVVADTLVFPVQFVAFLTTVPGGGDPDDGRPEDGHPENGADPTMIDEPSAVHAPGVVLALNGAR